MPVELTKNFRRVRRFSPKRCAPGSFRTKAIAKGGRLVVCCPKGKWSRKSGRCKVGMRAQSVLTRRKRR